MIVRARWRDERHELRSLRAMFWFSVGLLVAEIVAVVTVITGHTDLFGNDRTATLVITSLLALISVDTCRRLRRRIRPLREKLAYR